MSTLTGGEVVAATAGSLSAAAVTFSLAEDRENRQEVKLEVLRVCDGSEDVAECMQEAKETLD